MAKAKKAINADSEVTGCGEETFFTITQVARKLCVSAQSIRRYINAGLIKALELPGKLLISRTEYLRFVNSREFKRSRT